MPDIDLRELRLFLVLGEELHFGRTADRLGVTTSRVSQTLRALERKLGGRPLVHRTSRVVALTEAGRALHTELMPALAGVDRVLRAATFRSRGPGVVRVAQAEATCPARTPSGRPIRFVDAPVQDNAELLYLLARGRLVHLTVAPFAEHFQHPGVVAVPVRDLPPSACALVALRDTHDPGRDALLAIVAELVAA